METGKKGARARVGVPVGQPLNGSPSLPGGRGSMRPWGTWHRWSHKHSVPSAGSSWPSIQRLLRKGALGLTQSGSCPLPPPLSSEPPSPLYSLPSKPTGFQLLQQACVRLLWVSTMKALLRLCLVIPTDPPGPTYREPLLPQPHRPGLRRLRFPVSCSYSSFHST